MIAPQAAPGQAAPVAAPPQAAPPQGAPQVAPKVTPPVAPAAAPQLDQKPLALPPPIILHEYFFYVFDAAPMLLALILWNVFHPRGYLPGDSSRYLAQDGKTELKGPGWKDSESLTETFMNPFASLTNRCGHKKPFWERNGYILGTGGRSGRRVTRAYFSVSAMRSWVLPFFAR